MNYKHLCSERLDKVSLITLNRPESLNAMSYELSCELDEELTKLEGDDAVRAVILTGAGARAFSSGGDIVQTVRSTPAELAARSSFRNQAIWHIADFVKPIIGAVNGLAYGAGAELASLLDVRIGCEHAEFSFVAAKYGRANATWSLPHVVGMPMAKELLYTARVVKAEEAKAIGLLNHLVPCARLRDSAIELAQSIGANDPRSVQGIKRLLHQSIGMPWRESYEIERAARSTWLKSTNPREAFKDFLSRKRY
jgi:enoyl-CoA hydratase/carnithine racemase